MDETHSDGTREGLLDLVRAHGYPVSARQLARWHREGLIPRPARRFLGKGRGSESVYPPGTGEQLLALCEIHFGDGEKRLAYVAWRLWWGGYDSPLRLVREFLTRVATKWDRGVQELVEPETGGLSEHALKILDEASAARYDSKFMRRARKRVGGDQFGTLMAVMLGVASGAFEGYTANPTGSPEEDERRIVEKGFGLDRGRIGRKTNAESRLSDGLEETLREGSRLLGEHSFEEVLTTASDEDLLTARDWARSTTMGMELISVLARQGSNPEASGLMALGGAIREAEPPEQAILLLSFLTWGLWGPPGAREKLDSYHEQTRRVLLGLRELGEQQGGGANSFLHLYAKDARAYDRSEQDDESR